LRATRLDDQHRVFLAALAAAPPGARTLTFARGDLRGNRRALPSRWLLDIASVVEGRVVHATDFADLGEPTVEVVPSFATAIHGPVHASLEERDLAELASFVAQGGEARVHPLARLVDRGFELQAARRSSAFTEWDGNLAGQPIPSATERSLSPTRLERWATCGFRYFLGSVLDLADRDDPERVVELSPLDRGSGVHTALEQFLAEAIAEGAPEPDEPWSDAHHERLHQIVDEVFAALEARGRTGRSLLWALAATELHAMLDEFLEVDDTYRAESASRPERVELPFGLDDAPPVVLTLPDGRTLEFRGRADRVDRADDGHLLVSDYKTGRGVGYIGIDEGDPVREGRLLQLGLYAEAAHQLLGASSTEAHYWMVDPRAGYERRGYAWTDERRARFVEVLATIVEGIEGGVFPLVPGEWDSWRGTHSSCAYCDFDRLCVRDRGEQAEAKVDAPELRVRDRLVWVDGEEPT
jgi:ATP-dependent helicase/nuclease subunit B